MAYPSDLTDKQWQKIEHFFDNGNYGNRQKWDKRLLMNAVLYLLKSGCQWRMLPRDFPPYKTVWSFYTRACEKGIWEDILQELVSKDRISQGKKENPTYGIIDSQSTKTVYKSESIGIDGGKK